jgi:hypothetical protein
MRVKKAFAFLKSTRFWVLVAGCITIAVQGELSEESIIKAILTFVAGFITIRTVDRLGDKAAQAP